MNIDDILKRKEFKNLDKYLTKEMRNTAGEILVNKMIDVLGNEARAKEWFYSEAMALNSKRPYDLCKKGNTDEVELLLARIEHGIYI